MLQYNGDSATVDALNCPQARPTRADRLQLMLMGVIWLSPLLPLTEKRAQRIVSHENGNFYVLLKGTDTMEVKVSVDGIPRVVCGVTEETTCQEVVIALAQALGKCVCRSSWFKDLCSGHVYRDDNRTVISLCRSAWTLHSTGDI